MKNLFLWIWCFPQMALGLILKLIFKGKPREIIYFNDKFKVYNTNLKSGSISLGSYILLCEKHYNDALIIAHEYGHYKQSLMLGWLYLLVIGIPSIIWCKCFDLYRFKNDISYYSFYTEKWANKLGGVYERY